MIGSVVLTLTVGLVFLGGAICGWRARGSDGPRSGSAAHDTVLALQLRNESLRESARTAHDRVASLEVELATALLTTTHLELEASRLSHALEEANAEVVSANAWVRKVWRERAIAQGAPRRHPSAMSEERATPPEPAPRPMRIVRDGFDGPGSIGPRSTATWN